MPVNSTYSDSCESSATIDLREAHIRAEREYLASLPDACGYHGCHEQAVVQTLGAGRDDGPLCLDHYNLLMPQYLACDLYGFDEFDDCATCPATGRLCGETDGGLRDWLVGQRSKVSSHAVALLVLRHRKAAKGVAA